MADEFCLKMPDFHVTFRDLLHAVNLRHGTKGFASFPKEGVLRIFSPWKIRRLRPGLNPRTCVPKASTLPLDHRSRSSGRVSSEHLFWIATWEATRIQLILNWELVLAMCYVRCNKNTQLHSYTVKVLIAECNLSVKLKDHSFPDLSLYECLFVFV